MKNIIFIVAIFIFSIVQAQDGKLNGLKIGIHGGIPMAESKNSFKLNLGLDVAFMHTFDDGFGIGITTGYTRYQLQKNDDIVIIEGLNDKDFNVIPLALSLQFSITEKFYIGSDFGAAFFLNSANTQGGAYFQPKLGFQREKFEVYAGYKRISQVGAGSNIATVNLGINYKFR